MTVSVSFHKLAETELYEAAQYYESESEGLGKLFLDHIEAAVQRIQKYPESAPLINEVVRRMIVQRFPYNVLYSAVSDSVRILAIANQKRRPFYWSGRI